QSDLLNNNNNNICINSQQQQQHKQRSKSYSPEYSSCLSQSDVENNNNINNSNNSLNSSSTYLPLPTSCYPSLSNASSSADQLQPPYRVLDEIDQESGLQVSHFFVLFLLNRISI